MAARQSCAGLVVQCSVREMHAPGNDSRACASVLGHLHKDFNKKSHKATLSFEIAPRTSVASASSPREKINGF